MRDPAFYLLVAYTLLIAIFVLAKAIRNRGVVRRRCLMALLCCITTAAALALQIIRELAPFTSLGCLLCGCFFHVFVIQDEQTAKHMAELEQALERARVAERARSMFFSIVSHDIRTPLNAILGYSELLQSGDRSPSERDEALQAIRASGTTLLQLVNDVLDLAKMDSKEMKLHPEPMRLDRLSDDVFASFRPVADEKGIELFTGVLLKPLTYGKLMEVFAARVGLALRRQWFGSIFIRRGKMKIWRWAVAAFLLTFAVHAGETRVYRDASGRTTGTVYTNNGHSTYRDAQGRVICTSTRSGDTTIYRDASGRMIGRQTVSGDRTTCRDAQGRVVCTSTRSGDTTIYRDASGRMTGSATTNGGGTTYRDAQGRVRATQRR